jgi:citrate lyase subunit beta / citryl-CoA lyase
MRTLTRARSLLFMPATRADMIAKIPRIGPDVAVADLEDAVGAGDKERARGIAAAAIDALYPKGQGDDSPVTVLIRVNAIGTPWFDGDVAAAAGCAAAGIVVPKLATPQELGHVRQALAEHSWSDAVLVAGLETALGVADARALLSHGVSAVYFGAEDYIADIGGRRTRAGAEVLYARSRVALAAHLAGLPALDQVVIDLADDEHFLADAAGGRDLGYQGKMCIHPRQVALAHQVFTPTPAELAHAREVVAAAESGVAVVDGQMTDEAHVRMARTTLARAPQDQENQKQPERQ